MLKMQKEFEVL